MSTKPTSKYDAPLRATLLFSLFVIPLAILLLDALAPATFSATHLPVTYATPTERGVVLTSIGIGIALLLGSVVFVLCLEDKEDDA